MLTSTWAEQDFEAHEKRAEEWLASRPVCDMCQEPIQDDVYFEPDPGACLCGECFRQYVYDNFVRDIETE